MTKIYDLEIPGKQLELISKGLWVRPKNVDRLKSLAAFSNPDELDFLNVKGIKQESNQTNLVEDLKIAKINLLYYG